MRALLIAVLALVAAACQRTDADLQRKAADVGDSCGDATDDPAVESVAVPADAVWTDLSVAGMTCDGCARRIEKSLAKVAGVLGVKIDVATASVQVATARGIDARGVAKPTIDSLGYQVR